LALKENQISDLIQTPFGWHIIQVVKKTVDSKETQLQAARSKKFDEWLGQKRAAFEIAHFPPQTPSPTLPPTGTPAALPTAPRPPRRSEHPPRRYRSQTAPAGPPRQRRGARPRRSRRQRRRPRFRAPPRRPPFCPRLRPRQSRN